MLQNNQQSGKGCYPKKQDFPKLVDGYLGCVILFHQILSMSLGGYYFKTVKGLKNANERSFPLSSVKTHISAEKGEWSDVSFTEIIITLLCIHEVVSVHI